MSDPLLTAAANLEAVQRENAALRTQLAEAQQIVNEYRGYLGIEKGGWDNLQEAQTDRDALRTRCDGLESALRQARTEMQHAQDCYQSSLEEHMFQSFPEAYTAIDAALRNPSPAPRAVVTRPDEPPAQARERIRQ